MWRLPGRGLLIVFEGIDGAGKSTLVRHLTQRLASCGLAFVASREPTDGPAGQRLRRAALTGRLPAETELELFLEDRAQHVREVIEPALSTGKVVVLDRYYYSTAAYQGARGAGDFFALIEVNERFAPRPDLVVWVAIEPAVALQRIAGRGERVTAFEREAELVAVARYFALLTGPTVMQLDGLEPIASLDRRVWSRVVELLASHLGVVLTAPGALDVEQELKRMWVSQVDQ
jgi:dTMP kinase